MAPAGDIAPRACAAPKAPAVAPREARARALDARRGRGRPAALQPCSAPAAPLQRPWEVLAFGPISCHSASPRAQVLAVNHVFEMLLHFTQPQGGDWSAAVAQADPSPRPRPRSTPHPSRHPNLHLHPSPSPSPPNPNPHDSPSPSPEPASPHSSPNQNPDPDRWTIAQAMPQRRGATLREPAAPAAAPSEAVAVAAVPACAPEPSAVAEDTAGGAARDSASGERGDGVKG